MNWKYVKLICAMALGAGIATGCGDGSSHMKLEPEADAPASLNGSGGKKDDEFAKLEQLSKQSGTGEASVPVPPPKIELLGYDELLVLAQKSERAKKLDIAENYYLAALNLVKDSGPDEFRHGDLLRTLGFFYHMKFSRPDLAENSFLRLIEIREDSYGPESSEVADAAIDLTGVYNFQGKFEMSFPLYDRALANREKINGPESKSVASILKWYADALVQKGMKKEAAPLYARSNAILKKLEGK